jgi:secreted PhoX family phosphatase
LSDCLEIALDYAGNVWVVNRAAPLEEELGGSVSELMSPVTSATLGANFAPSGAMFVTPYSLALDNAGNIWVANCGLLRGFGDTKGSSISELAAPVTSSTAGERTSPPQAASFSGPSSLALDSLGNVWIANQYGNSMSELAAPVTSSTTGANFAQAGAAFSFPTSLALDSSGNIWLANNGGSNVSEILGLASPVVTPVQACLQQGENICLP